MGKTWLLRRFQMIAEENGTPTVFSDETEINVPTVMGHAAEELQRHGYKLKKFNSRYHQYQQKIGEIRSDPKAPEGLASLLAKAAVQALHFAGDLTPGLGKTLTSIIPWDSLETQVDLWFTYLGQKIKNKDDVRLVLQPIDVLTPLFLSDLEEIARNVTPIVFFFDTYEQTSEYLDPWLRNVLDGRYGILSPKVQFVIAGRKELNRNLWAPFESAVARCKVDIFTEPDVHKYMNIKGINNPDVVSVIMKLSNRLPLLVATLAAGNPDNPELVGDPCGEAVDRFLEWVQEPQQRRVAVDAALSRKVNQDIVSVLVGEGEANALFNWLKEMPFVEMRGDSWVYHDITRVQMLRYKRRESPKNWITLHEELALHYEGLRDLLGLTTDSGLNDIVWQAYSLEAIYHRLCQSPHLFLKSALNGFLKALEKKQSFARQWAETVHQAEMDLESPAIQGWGMILTDGFKALQADRYQEAHDMFTKLLQREDLEQGCRATALARRGLLLRLMHQYHESITDFSEAIEINDLDPWAIIQRGETYRQMGQVNEALKDLDRGIELESQNSWAFVLQGEIYRQLGQHGEALKKYDQALQLDPANAWIYVLHSEALRQMGNWDKALDGFNRAIELAPNYAWAITHRGEAYRQMGLFEEALADFNRAIEMDSAYTWAIILRGEAYRQMNRLEDALADFCRAIELEPGKPWPIVLRGEIHRKQRNLEKAIADYNLAIKLKPDYSWAITLRAEAYRQTGQYELALKDFARSIEIQPEDVWSITLRGELYRQMKNYQAALVDFNRALVLSPGNVWVLTLRGQTYCEMQQYNDALADFGKAIMGDPKYGSAYAHRGETYRQMQQYETALTDLNLSIEIDPGDAWAFSRRGEVYRQMGRFKEALSDFDTAVEMNPDDLWSIEKKKLLL